MPLVKIENAYISTENICGIKEIENHSNSSYDSVVEITYANSPQVFIETNNVSDVMEIIVREVSLAREKFHENNSSNKHSPTDYIYGFKEGVEYALKLKQQG